MPGPEQRGEREGGREGGTDGRRVRKHRARSEVSFNMQASALRNGGGEADMFAVSRRDWSFCGCFRSVHDELFYLLRELKAIDRLPTIVYCTSIDGDAPPGTFLFRRRSGERKN